MKKLSEIQKEFQILNHWEINVVERNKLSVKKRWLENVWEK